MNATLRSVLFKFAYAFIAAEALALTNWINTNQDMGAWTITSLWLALGTAAVAAIKKAVAAALVSDAG